MTCRDELLLLIKEHINSKGKNEFTLSEIVNLSKDKNLNFSESTINYYKFEIIKDTNYEAITKK